MRKELQQIKNLKKMTNIANITIARKIAYYF